MRILLAWNMGRWRFYWLVALLATAGGPAFALEILGNVPKAAAIVVANDPNRPVVRGESVCLSTQGQRYVCGQVSALGKKGFAVKVAEPPAKWLPVGTSVELLGAAETAAPTGASTEVDLNAVSLEDLNTAAAVPETRKQDSPHHGSGAKPKFRILFDFLLTNRPGVNPPITFDTYHNILWIEYQPSRAVSFAAEVAPNPRFFEIGYRFNRFVELKLGRIWIPFDDLGPHTIYGGRANIAKMGQPNAAVFLPDVWTDLGLKLNFLLARTRSWDIDAQLYVVNGFQEGGSDPLGGSTSYPDFSNVPLQDNNWDKAIGARVHFFYRKWLGFGASAYRARFSNQAMPSAGLLMLGTDTQIHVTPTTELRIGYAYMDVKLPQSASEFKRGGLYAEIGQGFGRFKFLVRAGQSQNDSRVVATTDQSIIGAALLYRPGAVQLSIEHSQDLNQVVGKTYYSYTGARLVAMF